MPLGALGLLRGSFFLSLAAKLRGGFVTLLINIIDDHDAQKHSPGGLPATQLQLMVLDDTRTTYWSRHLSLVTNGQKA